MVKFTDRRISFHSIIALRLQLDEYLATHIIYEPVANPLQTALVNVLIAKGAIQSKEVEEVMRSIDRGDFSPKEPYVDR